MDRPSLGLGVGAGNYAVVYDQYNLPRPDEPLGHAHNIYLNFAAEGRGCWACWPISGCGWRVSGGAARGAAASDRLTVAVAAGIRAG